MRANTGAEVARRDAFELVPLDVVPDLLVDRGEIVEVPFKFLREPDPRKVRVAWAIAEPPAHLKERVVGCRGPDEVAHDQPFEREPTRERVATDHDLDLRIVPV